MSELILVVIVAAYFVAGLIKGTLGIGFPTAAISLTATVVDVRMSIAMVVIPMCLINVWQIYRSGHLMEVLIRNWRLVVSMATVIGVFSVFSVHVPIRWLTFVLGITISFFAIMSLWRSPPRLLERFDHPAQWVSGAVSGVLGGLAGIWGPPIIVYLTTRRVSNEEFVQTMGVLLFIGSAILLAGFVHNGMVHSGNALFSAALLLPGLAGFAFGEKIRKRIASETFQKLVLLFFLILGINFIRRALVV